MKLAIDCRSIKQSGIGVFLSEILPYILDNENNYLLVGNRTDLGKYQSSNVEILNIDIKSFSIKELFFFPVEEINGCDCFWTPNFNIPGGIKIPILSTIHDVVFLDIQGITGIIGKIIRRYFLKRAVEISEVVFTVSNFSKSRLIHHFGDSDKFCVVYNGIQREIKAFYTNSSFSITKSPLRQSYIIFVGNIKKHKGLNILLDAFDRAKVLGFSKKMVIVGNAESFKTIDSLSLRKIIDRDDILFTGYIDNASLFNYISYADALIQPSLYEGFGIPPLEALYLGRQVILSDIEVFRELYNDLPVTFFQVGNSEDLCTKLMAIPDKSYNIQLQIDGLYNYRRSAEFIKAELLNFKR